MHLTIELFRSRKYGDLFYAKLNTVEKSAHVAAQRGRLNYITNAHMRIYRMCTSLTDHVK